MKTLVVFLTVIWIKELKSRGRKARMKHVQCLTWMQGMGEWATKGVNLFH